MAGTSLTLTGVEATATPGPPSGLLLEAGTDFYLLEDGSGRILLET